MDYSVFICGSEIQQYDNSTFFFLTTSMCLTIVHINIIRHGYWYLSTQTAENKSHEGSVIGLASVLLNLMSARTNDLNLFNVNHECIFSKIQIQNTPPPPPARKKYKCGGKKFN